MIGIRAYVTIEVESRKLILDVAKDIFQLPCVQQIDRLKQLSPNDPNGIMVVMADTVDDQGYISTIIDTKIKPVHGIKSIDVKFVTPFTPDQLST